jgi:hypothetical protein
MTRAAKYTLRAIGLLTWGLAGFGGACGDVQPPCAQGSVVMFSVHVIDSVTKAPICDATVHARGPDGDWLLQTWGGASCPYPYTKGVAAGSYTIRVQATGYGDPAEQHTIATTSVDSCRNTNAADVTFVLVPSK